MNPQLCENGGMKLPLRTETACEFYWDGEDERGREIVELVDATGATIATASAQYADDILEIARIVNLSAEIAP